MKNNTSELREVTQEELNTTLACTTSAVFEKCHFTGVTISTAEGRIKSLMGSRFFQCRFVGFNGQNTNLENAVITDCVFEDVNLRNANMKNIGLYGTMTKNTDFTEADLSGARIRHTSFNDATVLTSVNLTGANMVSIYFCNVVIDVVPKGLETVSISMDGTTEADAEYHKQQVLHTLNVGHGATEILNEKSRCIRVDGHIGTWYVMDTKNIDGKNYFLLEHEQHGDVAANIILDGFGTLILEGVYNGFDDLLDSMEVEKKKEYKVKIIITENDDFNEIWQVIGENSYFARHTLYNTWFFVNDAPYGYCELDHACPKEYVFIVCDQDGKELFRSTNGDSSSAFPAYPKVCITEWDKISTHYPNASRNGFRKWLLQYLTSDVLEKLKGQCCIPDNFCTFWFDQTNDEILSRFDYLGKKCAVHRLTMKSQYSEAMWYDYMVGHETPAEFEPFGYYAGWESFPNPITVDKED